MLVMPPSRIPIRSNRIVFDFTPKQSPLERVRQEFEHKRSLEKQRIRAINEAEKVQRGLKVTKNNNLEYCNDNVDKLANRYYTGSNFDETPHDFVSRNGENRLFQYEKRSAGRDRSHPLVAIHDYQLGRKRVEVTGERKQGKATSQNNFDASRPPNLMQMTHNAYKTANVLPPVGRLSVHSAHKNFPNVFKVSAEEYENSSDSSERSKAGRFSSASEMYRHKIAQHSPNQHNELKLIKQKNNNFDYSDHELSTHSPMNLAENFNAGTPTSNANEELIVRTPVPPSSDRLSNESHSGNARRHRAIKQKILEQQKLKMMKGTLGNMVDSHMTDSSCAVTPDNEEFSSSRNQQDTLRQMRNNETRRLQDDDSMDGSQIATPSLHRRHHKPAGGGASVPPRQLWRPTVDPNKEFTAFYINALDLPGAKADNVSFAECDMCKRSFAFDRIDRHKKICSKGPRNCKALDPVKMRLRGTEFAKYQDNNSEREQRYAKAKKSNWRQQHESFVANLQYARQVALVEKTGGAPPPPPPVTFNPDYVKCDWCGRNFNETVAKRHIPFCKEAHDRMSRAKPPARKQAKQR